ncbi:MAG TPA: hypothetical protein PKY73_12805, partial [Hyphomonas sp.]|nr:hypothetical protein [Hyphomonas sp.]
MTDQEQREVFIRGGMIAVCAVTATVSLPVISDQQAALRAEAEYRSEVQRFATFQDAGLAARADAMTPALLDTPWLRTVEYTLKRDPDSSMSRYAMRDRDGAALQRAGASRVGIWLSPGHGSLTYRQNFDQHARRLREVSRVLAD